MSQYCQGLPQTAPGTRSPHKELSRRTAAVHTPARLHAIECDLVPERLNVSQFRSTP